MPNRSKQKGTGFERELVEKAVNAGIPAYRCWGSDGRSRGLPKEVDLVLNHSIKLQTKRRSKLPDWLGLSDKVDGVVLRQDHGEAVAVIRWAWFLRLMRDTSRKAQGETPTTLENALAER